MARQYPFVVVTVQRLVGGWTAPRCGNLSLSHQFWNSHLLSAQFSKLAFVLALTSLTISGTAAVAEVAAALAGGIAGESEGALAGAALGYAAYQPLNVLENILG